MARFEEVARNRGVDSALPGHEWMMVPHDGDNLVRLADGDGYAVSEPGRARLTITEVTREYMAEVRRTLGPLSVLMPPNTRVFRVAGRAPGETTIVATKGSQRTALTVSVHRKRVFKIAFYFLQDRSAAGAATPRTAFSPTAARGWVAGLNEVFGPQSNIWFEVGWSEYLPLAGLNEAVGSPSDLATLAATRATSGTPITVFLAGPRIVSADRSEPLGFYDQPSKVIVVQDQFVADPWAGLNAPMLKTIAHEIGHYLNHVRGAGQGHDFFRGSGYNADILNTLDGGDIKIPHQRVLDWNPW
jgi:hypothetical protein